MGLDPFVRVMPIGDHAPGFGTLFCSSASFGLLLCMKLMMIDVADGLSRAESVDQVLY